jgi:hypothetical protein
MWSAILAERDGPAWDEAGARSGEVGRMVGTVSGAERASGVGAPCEYVGTESGWKPGTHFPPTVGAGKSKVSLVGDRMAGGVAATSGGVEEDAIDRPGYAHLMVSTRVGSPPQRS